MLHPWPRFVSLTICLINSTSTRLSDVLTKSDILVLLFNGEILVYGHQWKRPPAHYLTGLSGLGVDVSIHLLCFLSGVLSVKTDQAVYTVRFPASHVNGAQVLQVKRKRGALMSPHERIMSVWQPTFVR